MIPNKRCVLARILKEKGWTQERLAQETGVAQSIISRYCKATTNYNVNYLYAFVKALGLSSIDDLFEDE